MDRCEKRDTHFDIGFEFVIEFVTLPLDFVTFTQEFIIVTLTAINQLLITHSGIIFANELTEAGTCSGTVLGDF